MNTLLTLSFAILAFFATTGATAQASAHIQSLEFKLQLMADGKTWGVYVKPDNTITPSGNTMTGSGQVTLVVPSNFKYAKFKNHGGTWGENARVDNPIEAPGKSYVSFGFVTDEPRIFLFPNEETLLFTFTCDASFRGQIALIDNEDDPFAAPNSYGSNPGNDLGMIDVGHPNGLLHYVYARNFGEMQGTYNLEILASKND